jgi:hypothetical protein
VFRDDAGNATDYPGLQLRLRDFAYEELVQEQLGNQDAEIHISSISSLPALRKGNAQKHLQRKSAREMKRNTFSKKGKWQSARKTTTAIMRINDP